MVEQKKQSLGRKCHNLAPPATATRRQAAALAAASASAARRLRAHLSRRSFVGTSSPRVVAMSCIRTEATVVDWAEPLPSILRRRLASQQPKLPVEGGGWRAREALTEMSAMEAQERARVAIILCYMPSACGNRNRRRAVYEVAWRLASHSGGVCTVDGSPAWHDQLHNVFCPGA